MWMLHLPPSLRCRVAAFCVAKRRRLLLCACSVNMGVRWWLESARGERSKRCVVCTRGEEKKKRDTKRSSTISTPSSSSRNRTCRAAISSLHGGATAPRGKETNSQQRTEENYAPFFFQHIAYCVCLAKSTEKHVLRGGWGFFFGLVLSRWGGD